eukprot:gb/GEZN01009911.1/.p1 GENE.gb/GEZN01009911.1/~~gb/GEZN01009911.1/.p1  ORF type:complete len:209 (-),score=31.87 gb/GEZN01009911.1/:609-1235(-)
MISLLASLLLISASAEVVVLVSSGECNEEPRTHHECKLAAEALELKFSGCGLLHSTDVPTGCYYVEQKNMLYFNSDRSSTVQCGTAGRDCLCYDMSLLIKTESYCEWGLKTKEDCIAAADSLKLSWGLLQPVETTGFPKGCLYSTEQHILLFNTHHNSRMECSEKLECICYNPDIIDEFQLVQKQGAIVQKISKKQDSDSKKLKLKQK